MSINYKKNLRMKTLLQLNCTANWGSTGKIAEQIGLCAMAHGWDSYIAYGRWMNPSKSKLIRVGSRLNPYEHYAENLLLDNEGLASRLATRKFLQEVDRIKPDVVHLHNIHDHWINYRMLFAYLAEKKIPVVWTQHDQWATTGHCMYNLCGCERWKTECHDCPVSKWYSLDRSRRNFRLKKELLAAIPSLTIVPVSEWLGNNIRLSHLKDRPIEVIHNGIDIHTFSPQPTDAHERYGIDKHKKIILGVAALWDARKGLNDFYALANRLPKDEYTIVIVGRLTEETTPSEDGCQMIFVPRTQNMLELAQLYSSASVFVNPTYQDNYPTTNLEAIACGTPVITYATGGSPESVDESTGAVVVQGDIDGLVANIERLANGDYTEACRKKAEAEFDNSECFNPYISLYNKLLGGQDHNPRSIKHLEQR
jgi:putative colanic acid biosynthesis glycosyltransferase